MKKSLVKLVAVSATAMSLAAVVAPVSAEYFETPKDENGDIIIGVPAEDNKTWEDPNEGAEELADRLNSEESFSEVSSEESVSEAEESSVDPEDPFGANKKVETEAPKNAFENVDRHFGTLAEAVEAYPDAFVMFDAESQDYVVFTDRGAHKVYVFGSVQDAVNAFPNLDPLYEDGKYYVFSDQAPRLQYAFDTEQEAYDTFGFDANPMYDAASGKYLVYTNKLPKLTYEFDSYEDAMAAFPGSYPMFADGKYYVFTTFEKRAGTNGTVLNPVEGELQDDEFAENQKEESAKVEDSEATDSEEAKEAKEADKSVEKEEAEEADSKETDAEELPETGEASNVAIFSAAALSVLAGLGLVAPKFNKEN